MADEASGEPLTASEDGEAPARGLEAEGGEESRDRRERRAKVERLRAAGEDPFPRRFPGRVEISTVLEAHDPGALEHGEHSEWSYRVAGRLVARRGHGKTTFLDVRDRSGTIQIFAREDLVGEEEYERLLSFDIGDVVGVEGVVYVTKRRQLALSVRSGVLMAKALAPPPDMYHGVASAETRYHQRELDLMANERSREVFELRSRTVREIRRFMDEHGFVEIETPTLLKLPGGAAARPFVTHHNALDRELSLRTSTELYLKRCIVGGMENVYELGKSFRNEGISPQHNPEFTMMEWFVAYTDYQDAMDYAERMVAGVTERVLGTTVVERDGVQIDFAPPWRRVTVRDAVLEVSGVDVLTASRSEMVAALGPDAVVPDEMDWAGLVNELQGELVEPGLIQPTFITDLPLDIWPLVNVAAADPRLGEAFDAIVGGMEIIGGGTDINDPIEQEKRFVEQRRRQERGGEDNPHPHDHEFVRALEYGMLPASGAGLGIDRFVMLLSGAKSLREVVLFPA